ncbi:MAG: NnrU family protein [Rhodocyclaceae bacterium]|nr:NnrU family protein [Rhodocyclaceae bacterium]
MTLLILGLALFLGVHSLRILAPDWRDAQIARLGEKRWKGVYSLLSVIGLGLIILGYGLARADSPVLWHSPTWTRHLTALLTLPAFILLVAAYVPGSHIKAVVGHPMVAGVKIWALAHLLANGKLSAATLFGAFLIWAIVNFASSHRRDRVAGRTYPVLGWSRDAMAIMIGGAAWALFALYGHLWLIGVRPFG